MTKKILLLTLALCAAAICGKAQNYTNDAALVRTAGNYAVIECSGVAKNKKEAGEMAKKSAIYTYLYSGIEGLNNGRPLLGLNPTKKATDAADRILLSTGYANYIRNCTFDERKVKTAGKDVQVFATIELYVESLEKYLVNNGAIDRKAENIAIADTQEMIAMPTVMVVPFRHDGQSYEEALRANSDMQMAIAKVNEGFIAQGVETKDLLTCINNAEMYRARMGDNMSLDDAILSSSGADISVSVNINKDENPSGMRVSLVLQAIEIATGNTLASTSEVSGRKRATADAICGAMAKYMVGQGGFMKQIQTRLATKISTGQSISLRFTIADGAAVDMDTEINSIMPLSDILVSWVKRHAKNGRYHSQGRTSTLLAFSDIYIDNSIEDGMQSDINDFALALYKYLRGLELNVTRTITGNSVDIVIN